MTISLTKPNANDVGWAASINQNFTDIENAINPITAVMSAIGGSAGTGSQSRSVTVNGNTLATDGDFVVAIGMGRAANSSSAFASYGGTTFLNGSAASGADRVFFALLVLTRTGSSSQDILSFFVQDNGSSNLVHTMTRTASSKSNASGQTLTLDANSGGEVYNFVAFRGEP